jgi:copper chaperone NosL
VKGMLALGLAVSLLGTLSPRAVAGGPAKPGPRDKCPVCGMFVHKFPDFLTQIRFKDGSTAYFDGAKDMFKFYFQLQKYNPKQEKSSITAIYVMDYYSLNAVDGTQAFYVIGSDTFGPMGRELIPFAKESEARQFMKDHKGTDLLPFGQVTFSVVKGLDQ